MFSKLPYHADLNILRITFYLIFRSHLIYGCQLWKQANTEYPNTIQTLQNRAPRKVSFKERRDPTNKLYKNLRYLNSLIWSVYKIDCLW